MQPEKQAPSVEHRKPPRGDFERYPHPAYGMASLQKTQASEAMVELFGSQLQHKILVKLRIETAYRARDPNRDWHRNDNLVAEMAMSEDRRRRQVRHRSFHQPSHLQRGPGGPAREYPQLIAEEKDRD